MSCKKCPHNRLHLEIQQTSEGNIYVHIASTGRTVNSNQQDKLVRDL